MMAAPAHALRPKEPSHKSKKAIPVPRPIKVFQSS